MKQSTQRHQQHLLKKSKYLQSKVKITKDQNSIVIRQDLQATKIKLTLELEKVAVLQAHYDGVIAKELGIDLKKDAPATDANASK